LTLFSFQFDVLLDNGKDELLIVELKDSPEAECLSHFKKMFESSDFSDFQLKSSDGQVFKIHKSVLSRSPVFYAMLTNENQKTKKKIEHIRNIDGVTLKELLRFIYYCRVKNLPDVAEKLISAADQYQLEKLKMQCCNSLIDTLTIQNVMARILIADQLTGTKKLYSKCMKLILK